MRMPIRLLPASVISVTTAAAISLGAASGAMAAAHAPASATVASTVHTTTQRVYTKSVKLPSPGHTAKVYKTGKRAYQADVLFKGKKIATVTARGKITVANLNGLHIKLTCAGHLTSWTDRATTHTGAHPQPHFKSHPRPKARSTSRQAITPGHHPHRPASSTPRAAGKRVLAHVDTLPDGSTAKVYRMTTNHYQADISADVSLGTLDADGRAAAGENNGLHIVLSPDGRLTSWLDESPTTDPVPTPVPDTRVAPDSTPVPDTTVTPDPTPVPDTKVAPDPAPVPDTKATPDSTPETDPSSTPARDHHDHALRTAPDAHPTKGDPLDAVTARVAPSASS